MSHPLDGARLKIVRAQEHLDAFKSEGGLFLGDPKPYRFESQVYGQHWWVKPHLTRQPPPHLSAVVGDCITNVRASLDYIMWELAHKFFTVPVDVSKQSDRQILNFPMLLADPNRRQGYVDHLDRLTKRGLPAKALHLIKAAQADVSGNSSLQWLYELVNTDKHRTPILTIGSFEAAQIEVQNFRGKNWLIRSDIIKDGVAIRAEPDMLEFVSRNPMNVNVQASVQITTQDVTMPREPLERTLEQFIETSANLVRDFDTLLL